MNGTYGMRVLCCVLFVLAILASTCSSVIAETLFVPGDHATIQGAIDAAVPGDTILVGAGEWVESLLFHGKNVRVESIEGPWTTTIRAQIGTTVDIGPGGALVGFTVTGGVAAFGAGMAVHGEGTLVLRNVFDGNIQTAGGFGAAIGGNSASPIIEGNLFRGNSCDSQFLSGVVAFVNGSRPRIVNNVFEDNPCRALTMILPVDGRPEVINNTIVRNQTGIRVGTRVPAVQHIYRNNIIVENAIGIEFADGGGANDPTFENNLVFGNDAQYVGAADRTGIDGNIAEDPRFRSDSPGGYRLRADSPAIDAGLESLAPDTDFDLFPRPLDGDREGGAAPDIGAFEFVPLDLDVFTDRRTYRKGDLIEVAIGADNPGIATELDLYLGILYPDGDRVLYFTDRAGSRANGSLADLASILPMASSFDLTEAFDVIRDPFVMVAVTDSEPTGAYRAFWQAVRPGSFADGSINPGDVVAESAVVFRVVP